MCRIAQDSAPLRRIKDMAIDSHTDGSYLNMAGFAGAVLDALPDATAILDSSGTIIAVNRVWLMFALDNGGNPETTGVGVNYLEVCARAAESGCTDAAEVLAGLRAVLAGETVESDREYPCPSPTVGRWFTSRITPIGDPIGGAVVSHVNISRRKMSEQELAHRASHDPLTGLANRLLFADRVSEALRMRPSRREVTAVGLLYIDLDDFKSVNDTYGHDAGDEVLLTATHRLRSAVRRNDTAARLGGDEFAVCAPRITPDQLTRLAHRIEVALSEPHHLHGNEVHVGASVGTHMANESVTVAEALRLADKSMYAIKRMRSEHKLLA
jgi:diguanylate cyclase (GGDEF)-like protein